MKCALWISLCILCFFISPGFGLAEDPPDATQVRRDAWSDYYAAQLPRYRFTFASKPDQAFRLEPVSLLRWSNPLRPGTHGDLYVWSQEGRGVLIGSVFSYPSGDQRRVAHQFHSLSKETIDCDYSGDQGFQVVGPGLDFQLIQAAPAPAKSRVARLVQMRRLSAQFKASCMNKSVPQPLRQLSQPIYRFRGEGVKDDGAIFPFVMGTDPELILVLSVQNDGEAARWHWAAARFASEPLELTHHGKLVWSFDGRSKGAGYVSRHGIDFQPKTPEVPDSQ